MTKFFKVSFEQYKKDIGGDVDLTQEYNDIKIPQRATKGSAGYDFFSPCGFDLKAGESFKFPTGIRVKLSDGLFLAIYPRSGLGFKYGIGLANTCGIIDEDFFESSNEGHIWIKLVNRGNTDIHINKGEAVAQGIIQAYFKTTDDDASATRDGGFGSTDKKGA